MLVSIKMSATHYNFGTHCKILGGSYYFGHRKDSFRDLFRHLRCPKLCPRFFLVLLLWNSTAILILWISQRFPVVEDCGVLFYIFRSFSHLQVLPDLPQSYFRDFIVVPSGILRFALRIFAGIFHGVSTGVHPGVSSSIPLSDYRNCFPTVSLVFFRAVFASSFSD